MKACTINSPVIDSCAGFLLLHVSLRNAVRVELAVWRIQLNADAPITAKREQQRDRRVYHINLTQFGHMQHALKPAAIATAAFLIKLSNCVAPWRPSPLRRRIGARCDVDEGQTGTRTSQNNERLSMFPVDVTLSRGYDRGFPLKCFLRNYLLSFAFFRSATLSICVTAISLAPTLSLSVLKSEPNYCNAAVAVQVKLRDLGSMALSNHARLRTNISCFT